MLNDLLYSRNNYILVSLDTTTKETSDIPTLLLLLFCIIVIINEVIKRG